MRWCSRSLGFLAFVVGLNLGAFAMAHEGGGSGDYAVWPRVVAIGVAVEPRGLASIRTRDGTPYEVPQGTTWRVGDTVAWGAGHARARAVAGPRLSEDLVRRHAPLLRGRTCHG